MTDLAVLFFYIDCPAKEKVGDRKCRLLRFPSFFFSLIADCLRGIDIVNAGLDWSLIWEKGPWNWI